MANIVRPWKRVLAIGCTHGEYVHPRLLSQIYALTKSFKPDYRLHLGDLVDTAAFRGGAHNTPDEYRPLRKDYADGVALIKEWQPTHIAWGNHDWRLEEATRHPNNIKAFAAQVLWTGLNDAAREVGAQIRPYHIEDGWFSLGGYDWGHGYMFNEQALRDHAEMRGRPVVMAHIHTAMTAYARNRNDRPSFCVGMLANKKDLTYAHRMRTFTRWSPGAVYGEVCGEKGRLWLITGNQSGLEIPSFLL